MQSRAHGLQLAEAPVNANQQCSWPREVGVPTSCHVCCSAGREVREQLFEQVSDLLHGLDEGMVPLSVFFPYAPIPVHFKRDR